ncbi:MAG: HAMP domain-containing histidine kinase [Planctomyces sp.]|nr:HAMP domain-containing histidine kinase [Planctomyces sp.]
MSNKRSDASLDISAESRQSIHWRNDSSHGPMRNFSLPGLMELEDETIVWSDSFADQMLGVAGTCTGRFSREVLGEGLSELLRTGRLCSGEPGTSMIVDSVVTRADGLILPISFRIWPCWRNRNTFYLISVTPGSEIPEAMDLNRSSLLKWAQLHRRSVIGEIASALIHELGQSLTSIQGIAEVLNSVMKDANSVSENDARQAVTLLLNSSRRATCQLNQIWQFLKTDQPSLSEVNPSELLIESAAIVSASGRHELTSIEVEQPASLTPWFTDLVILKTMLVRLIRYCMNRNFVFRSTGRKLLISLAEDTAGATIELRNVLVGKGTQLEELTTDYKELTGDEVASSPSPDDLLPADALSFCTAAARFLGIELLLIRNHRSGDLEACLRIPNVLLKR